MPKPTRAAAACTVSVPPASPPPAPASSASVSVAVSQGPSSSPVRPGRAPSPEGPAAGESRPRGQPSNSRALFEEFLSFMQAREAAGLTAPARAGFARRSLVFGPCCAPRSRKSSAALPGCPSSPGPLQRLASLQPCAPPSLRQ